MCYEKADAFLIGILPFAMAFVLSKSKDGTVEALYFEEIVKEIKENKLKIPIASYFLAFPLTIKFVAINTARKNKFIKKLFHKYMNKNSDIRYNDID